MPQIIHNMNNDKRLKAGTCFYVIAQDNIVDRYQVLKHRGKRMAILGPNGPVYGQDLVYLALSITKFYRKADATRFLRLRPYF